MQIYEFVKSLSCELSISEEHIDLILTEMTNVLNETILSGNAPMKGIMEFAKKRKGLVKLVESVTERTQLPEDEVSAVINHMCNVMRKSLKSGGVKAIMNIVRSMKNGAKHSADTDDIEDTSADDTDSPAENE